MTAIGEEWNVDDSQHLGATDSRCCCGRTDEGIGGYEPEHRTGLAQQGHQPSRGDGRLPMCVARLDLCRCRRRTPDELLQRAGRSDGGCGGRPLSE
ncbi:MAG TPA: hypothetical protein VMM60_14075 [Ilumatobacter sp.]|nr:hypothetical protein [Ilumatobacter sp.]